MNKRILSLFENGGLGKPVFAAANPTERSPEIVDFAEVDRLVTVHGLREPFVALSNTVSGIVPFDPRPFYNPWSTCADASAVLREVLKSGTTLILKHSQIYLPAIRALAFSLECERPHLSVQVNCYLTPPNSPGLSPHTDPRDTLLIQQHGTKRWRVWAIGEPEQSNGPDRSGRLSDAPCLDVALSPGDMLLIPTGCLHSSTTQTAYSLHVTLGLLTADSGAVALEDISRIDELLQVV